MNEWKRVIAAAADATATKSACNGNTAKLYVSVCGGIKSLQTWEMNGISLSRSLSLFFLSLSLAFSLEVYWSVRLFVFVFSRFSSPPLALCLMCVHTIPFRLFFWTIRYSRPNNTVFVCECEYVSLCGMRIFTFYYSSLYSIEEECMAQCSNKYHSTQRYIYIQYWMAYSFFAVQLSINP